MAYLGDLLLFGATACTAISLVLYLMVWRGRDSLKNLARNFFTMTAVLLLLAMADLLYLILTHDFTVAYVYSYSSTDLPLGYLIASLWGGQEGTFLLWVFFTAFLGIVMAKTAKEFEHGNMFFINLFIFSIMLILLKKSPFELMPVFRAEGAGLNPLLQNFWMTIHPPIMFIGFSGVVFPFAFAMTALVSRKYHVWAEAARKWTLFAWATLGTSLVMGGYWAYKTLGWGGFWAWDPVENSSFIPWIFLTTQIHALFIKRQRRGLMRFSLLVVCISFLSVLYGTFLTRSGVLADFSVHSFVDLGINQFLISSMLMFVGMVVFFMFWRWSDIRPEPSFSQVNSRSYIVTLGVVILSLGGVLVLLGTSAPLLTRLTDTPSAVGIPYYFATMTPIAISILILLTIFPAFKWNKGVSKPKILIIGGVTFSFTISMLLLTGFTFQIIYLLLFGLTSSAFVVNAWVFVKSWSSGNFLPGYLGHVGLALGLTGAAVSAGFETKQTLKLPQNEIVSAMGYDLKFTEMVENPKGFDCHVEISGVDGEFVAVLPHEFPKNQEGVMRKPHVEKFVSHDFYLAPVAMEEGSSTAGQLKLAKGTSATIGKYELTFHDFDLDSHGEEGLSKAIADISVSYDGKTEKLAPYLEVKPDGVDPVPAKFDYDKGMVMIAGISPDDGSVILQVSGDFVSGAGGSATILVVELSKKPLIILFWLGSIILFLSGILSAIEYGSKRKKVSHPAEQKPKVVAETVA